MGADVGVTWPGEAMGVRAGLSPATSVILEVNLRRDSIGSSSPEVTGSKFIEADWAVPSVATLLNSTAASTALSPKAAAAGPVNREHSI